MRKDGIDGDGNGFKPRNAEVNFHGQRRSNATHASTTDPQAKLYKKSDGQAGGLYHMGHALAENRHGLLMGVCVSPAAGDAEPAADATPPTHARLSPQPALRKKIEEAFGWIKTMAILARTKLIGRWKITQPMHLAAAAYNLVRMRKLAA